MAAPDLAPSPPDDALLERDAAPAAETPSAEPALQPPCPNCDTARADGAFCPACGQRHPDERLTLRALWRTAASRVFNFDRGLLHTLARLAGGPGRVPADYVAGVRQRYTHPLSFYLLTAAVSLFATGLYADAVIDSQGDLPGVAVQIDDADREDSAEPTEADSPRDRLRAAADRLNGDDGKGVIRRVTQIQSRIGTPVLVFFALFLVVPLRLLFGPRRNVAETAVFTLYVVGGTTFALAVVTSAVYLTLPFEIATGLATGLTLLGYAGVTAWGATAFWEPGWKTVAKATVAGLLGYVVYAFVAGIVSLVLLASELLADAGLGWSDVPSL